MNSIDWNAVRAYYLECRSYKLTAERFELSMVQVKNRAIRGNWKSATSEVSNPATCATSEVSNLATSATSEVSNPATSATPEVSNLATSATPEVSNLATSATSEVSNLATSATSEVSNPATSVRLPMLPNLTTHVVEFGKPWETPIAPHDSFPDKAAYHAHISSPATKDCLFSGIRGINANNRVCRNNPAAALIAVVADYDARISDKRRATQLSKMSYKPNFISTSYSGGTHAIWLLECPIPILPGGDFEQILFDLIKKELKLATAFGPLDQNAFYNSSQYYHAGWEWRQLHTTPIPEARCLRWFNAAMNKHRMGNSSGVIVPLERVRDEMKTRFPGRWQGEFELGSRGCRFWDSSADNHSAAIVTERGMVCFTGPFPFQSWQDIFGQGFIEQYMDDRIGQVLREFYCIGNNFYVLTDSVSPDGSLHFAWTMQNRMNVETRLAKRFGFSTKTEKDDPQSEVKDMLGEIMERNTLEAAVPLIYREPGKTLLYGKPVLNTSFLKVYPPEMEKGKSWGDGFSWIAQFMEGLFPDIIQREKFMAAWAYAYRNAYLGEPKNGHTIFIAGGRGVGKNFLTECLYGASMGGYSDASDYVLGSTRFNSRLFEVGVWTCNDTVTKGNNQERSIFSKFLKKLAANRQHVFEGKFKDSLTMDWQGRILVTLNTDPMSLAILPDIDINNADKISLFKASDKVLDDKDAARHAREEMGALCAFLLNWEFPEHCIGDARWGVKNYLHPELAVEATNSGSTSAFGEILSLYVRDMFAADPKLERLEGSATWFLQQMLSSDAIKEMLRGTVTAHSIGKNMGALAASGSFPLRYQRCHSGRVWWITRAEFESYSNNNREEDYLDEECPF